MAKMMSNELQLNNAAKQLDILLGWSVRRGGTAVSYIYLFMLTLKSLSKDIR